jgi:hypothetical protein
MNQDEPSILISIYKRNRIKLIINVIPIRRLPELIVLIV